MGFVFLVPYLVLLAGGFLPSRLLGGGALLAGAAALLAIFGLTLAILLGPNSDTSMHESNWESHQGHGFFVAVLAGEAAVASLFAFLGLRRPPASSVVRALFIGTTLLTVLITYAVLIGLSN